MRVASSELERSLLRGLLTGALWTATRVQGYGMRKHSACPHCGTAHEDKVHVLLQCPNRERSTEPWHPRLQAALARLLQLGPLDRWPACLRRAGLMPLQLAKGMDRDCLDEFLYRLYSMYLAVLVARIAAGQADPQAPGTLLSRFPPGRGRAAPTHGETSWAPCPGGGGLRRSAHAYDRGPRGAGAVR